jgi:peptidoglycan hydrolase-like protein with peptidoglycan-binding domain
MGARRTRRQQALLAAAAASAVVASSAPPAAAAQVSGTGQFPANLPPLGNFFWYNAPRPGDWFGPGNTGDGVGMLQHMLRNAGISPGLAVDGGYGSATTDAVKAALVSTRTAWRATRPGNISGVDCMGPDPAQE